MKRILYYYAEISDGTGIIRGDNKFIVKERNVIGENDINIVVDDLYFTTVKKVRDKYDDYSTCIGIASIHIHNNDRTWGNNIRYTLYTYNHKPAKKIKAEIEREIKKKFGFFLGKLDLSIIKEPVGG